MDKRMQDRAELLTVKNLKVSFQTRQGNVEAVRDVNFTLHQGEILALVGESGCGKSVTANSIMGLIGRRRNEKAEGEVLFGGQNLLEMSERALRKLRGNRISMIFQDPMTSLNPVRRVGGQLAEVSRMHEQTPRQGALDKAVEMLRRAGIPAPERRVHDYPFQFSGGMRQRSIIAMSLMCKPEILIADEPTTALDVTIQAQVLELLQELRDQSGVAILLITHDLAVVAETCDSVAVMYAGEVVERAPVEKLFRNPTHPYTMGLLDCLPVLGKQERLQPIPGQLPSLIDPPAGCKFAPRCAHACERCNAAPPMTEMEADHFVACWRCVHDE